MCPTSHANPYGAANCRTTDEPPNDGQIIDPEVRMIDSPPPEGEAAFSKNEPQIEA